MENVKKCLFKCHNVVVLTDKTSSSHSGDTNNNTAGVDVTKNTSASSQLSGVDLTMMSSPQPPVQAVQEQVSVPQQQASTIHLQAPTSQQQMTTAPQQLSTPQQQVPEETQTLPSYQTVFPQYTCKFAATQVMFR